VGLMSAGFLLFGATITGFSEFLQKLYYIGDLLAGQSRSGMKGSALATFSSRSAQTGDATGIPVGNRFAGARLLHLRWVFFTLWAG
jgi:hypothetical protein